MYVLNCNRNNRICTASTTVYTQRGYIKQASHWHEFCSRNGPHATWRAKSCHFSGTKSVKTERWRIVRALSCHLSRISYELLTKCATCTQCHACALNKSWHLGNTFFNISKFSQRHALLHPTRIATQLTPNCVPWRKPLSCQCAAFFTHTI